MCFKIILKFTKKPGFHALFRRYIFWKTEGQFDSLVILGWSIQAVFSKKLKQSIYNDIMTLKDSSSMK